MDIKYLVCETTGKKYPAHAQRYVCEEKGVVRVGYEYSGIEDLKWEVLRSRPFNHERYVEFYPRVKKKVSLGEGGTPLIASSMKGVYYKMEMMNPTGSFKDRGSAVEIAHAVELGAREVVCASTGNMGASVAAYCARAGLKCTIVLPAVATGEKIAQIRRYGAKIIRVRGDYTAAAKKAYSIFEKGKAFLVGDYAFRGEGEKSVGFELLDQMSTLDYVIIPIGNGTLISSIWRGMKEMKYAGLVKRLPKLIGVQARGCKPVYDAYRKDSDIKAVMPKTIAGAIACGDPIDGRLAVRSVRESKGDIVTVTDQEMLRARHALAKEGIDCEPAGCAPKAALGKLGLEGKKVALVLCGSGFKDQEHV